MNRIGYYYVPILKLTPFHVKEKNLWARVLNKDISWTWRKLKKLSSSIIISLDIRLGMGESKWNSLVGETFTRT